MSKSKLIVKGTGRQHVPTSDARVLQTVQITEVISTGSIGKRKANKLINLKATAGCAVGDEDKFLVPDGTDAQWIITTYTLEDGERILNAQRPFQQDTVGFDID